MRSGLARSCPPFYPPCPSAARSLARKSSRIQVFRNVTKEKTEQNCFDPACFNSVSYTPIKHVRGKAMDILLVDDHADITRLLARLLTRHGHRVREANDYLSALDAARAARPDLLIC